MSPKRHRVTLKIVGVPMGQAVTPWNTNILEAFEAQSKNMIGPETSIPIRSRFGSSIHIKSAAFFLSRTNVSVILRSTRRKYRSYATLSEYKDRASRVSVLSEQPKQKHRNTYVHMQGVSFKTGYP